MDDAAAAEYYTKSLFSSPKGTVEIALAHANRAAAFMRTDFYEVETVNKEIRNETIYTFFFSYKIVGRIF